jgi:putative hydrolase of the HAD superfamily
MTAQTSLPTKADFAHVTDWVFDLDNTLYPHHVDLFAQIDRNMTGYVANLLGLDYDEARALQKKYYYDHGTTLAGLMHHHSVDPHHFLDAAHAIDYSPVLADPDLADAIKALPGRKFIFTNGTVKHAEAAARALGVLDHFEDIFDIVAADFVPKPANSTYDKFASLHRVDTKRAAMFEDLPRNLIVPRLLGMKTILIQPLPGFKALERWEEFDKDDDNIDFATDRLADFLKAII